MSISNKVKHALNMLILFKPCNDPFSLCFGAFNGHKNKNHFVQIINKQWLFLGFLFLSATVHLINMIFPGV